MALNLNNNYFPAVNGALNEIQNYVNEVEASIPTGPLVAETLVTAAQIATLWSTKVEILPAADAGFWNEVDKITIQLIDNGDTYGWSTSGDLLAISTSDWNVYTLTLTKLLVEKEGQITIGQLVVLDQINGYWVPASYTGDIALLLGTFNESDTWTNSTGSPANALLVKVYYNVRSINPLT
jgi:hypothetical protein